MKKLLIVISILLVQPAFAAVEVSEFHFGENTTMKPGGLLQVWGIGNQNVSAKNENIRLRRAEIKVTGNIAMKDVRYFLMADPSRLIVGQGAAPAPAISMVQDLGVGVKIIPQLELIVGQFKSPTTAEGLDSSAQLPLPERSYVGRTFGDKREFGVELVFREPNWATSVMLSRGVPLGRDVNGFRDLDARFEMKPVVNLGLGTFATLGNGFDYVSKGRYGLNARYKMGKVKFRTEFAHAVDSAKSADGMDNEVEWDFTENVETVFRYEFYVPNFGTKALSQAETVGVNYYLRDWNSKLQFSASMMQNMASPNGTPTLADGQNNAEMLIALQAAI